MLIVRIPANATTGPDVPIVLTIGGKQSNQVTLPIAPERQFGLGLPRKP